MNFLGKELKAYSDPFIVAEISCNHEGSIDKALALIKAAKELGANAVKIQVYTPDEMTIQHKKYIGKNDEYEIGPNEFYIKDGRWRGKHLWDLYSEAYTPIEWLPELFGCAKDAQIPMFASVFGEKSLEALEDVGCPAYKIASFELNDTNLLKLVHETGKPMVLSAGIATLNEVERAMEIVGDNSVLMHCISKYPAHVKDLQLNRIKRYRSFYNCPIGFSDHTTDSTAASMTIGVGACIIEKHLTLPFSNSHDVDFSLTPKHFRWFVQDCKDAAKAIQEKDNIEFYKDELQFKRSLYVVQNIKQGEQFTKENVRSIRPGYGLSPHFLDDVLAKTAKYDIKRGTALTEEMLS